MTPAGNIHRALARVDWGVVTVTGADARRFLQGQFCGDIGQVTPDRGQLTGWCNPQGRVLFTFYLLRIEDGFLLVLPADGVAPLIERLRLYVLRAAVTIADVTSKWRIGGEIRSGSPATARHVIERAASGVCINIDGRERWLCMHSPAFAAASSGTDGSGRSEWVLADIRDALPILDSATRDLCLPQELNLDLLGGLSFDKGCYPGQEIVARMHFRGRLKRRLAVFTADSARTPAPGTPLYAEADAGAVNAGAVIAAAACAPEQQLLVAVGPVSTNSILRLATADGTRLQRQPLPYLIPAADDRR